MNRLAPAPAQPARRRLAAGVVLGLGVAAIAAFALGRWSIDSSSPSDSVESAQTEMSAKLPDRKPALYSRGRRASLQVQPALSTALDATAEQPQTQRRRADPGVVTRVTQEATQELEQARAEIIERCVPQHRLAYGQPSVNFTFNITFDANGREIARGINEDRRHRAPEVASCLRKLPLGSLRVSAPGANVGVRVPMSLP